MRLGYDVEKMKTAWADYFTKASFNKQTSTSSMIFDDDHWTFADISEQK